MKTKREESILDIIASFEEMADTILIQLTILEKYMAGTEKEEHDRIVAEIRFSLKSFILF